MTEIEYLHFLSALVFCDGIVTWNSLNETEKGELFIRLTTEGGGMCACHVLGNTFMKQMEGMDVMYREHVEHVEQQQKKLSVFVRELERQHIRFALFKGADLAERIYPSPECRTYCDWDVIFHPDEISEALKFLRASGWCASREYGDLPQFHHYPQHVRDGITLEPHWSFLNLPQANATDLWNEMVPVENSLFHYCLSPELYIIVLCRHAAESGYGHVRSTKFLLDIGYLLKSSPQIDWGHIRDLCMRWNVPYAGNLLCVWQDFFPPAIVAAINPDYKIVGMFREVITEREKLGPIDHYTWVMNYNQANNGKSWMGNQISKFRPDMVRAMYAMPPHGHYVSLALNYFRYGAHRGYLLLTNLKRYNPRIRRHDKLVASVEHPRINAKSIQEKKNDAK